MAAIGIAKKYQPHKTISSTLNVAHDTDLVYDFHFHSKQEIFFGNIEKTKMGYLPRHASNTRLSRQRNAKNAENKAFIDDNLRGKKKMLKFGGVKNIFLSN